MARYRQSLHLCVQGENEGQNTCSSCFATTKYSCLHCAMPICNKCSVFEDNEEASGWAAGKRVGYCEPCNEQLGRGHKPITEENQASCSRQESDTESESDRETLNDEMADKELKKKVGRKSSWPEEQLDDFIDIVVNDEYFKTKLIFHNTKKQKNGQVYEKILKQLRERCHQRGEEITLSVNQLRSKFKRCVSECKKAVMTIKTASGIDNFIDKKGYGRWFNQLYALVKTRDSCLPDQAIEPSAQPRARSESDIEHFTEQGEHKKGEDTSADKPEKLFVPVRSRKRKSPGNPMTGAIELMRTAIENDPVKDLIKMVQTEMDKSREHELKLMQMMMATGNSQNQMPNPPFNMQPAQPQIITPQNPSYNTQDFPTQHGYQGFQFQPVSPVAVSRPTSRNSNFSVSGSSVESDSPVYYSL